MVEVQIQEKLTAIEAKYGVKVLYAVESGSRAWGFASQNSDYDVRFIYVHSPEWYLSIDNKRDVIEEMDGELDLVGWDIKKALQLLRKSNPCLLEWLASPIIYREFIDVMGQFREISKEYFSPKRAIYHYLHMAEGNFREYLQRDIVWTKKYFYVLRPIFACWWISETSKPIPMEFDKLMKHALSSNNLPEIEQVERLLTAKRAGDELDSSPKNVILNDYLKSGIDFFKERVKEFQDEESPKTDLDKFFQSVVRI